MAFLPAANRSSARLRIKSVSVERGSTGSEEPKSGASFAYTPATSTGGSAMGGTGGIDAATEGGNRNERNCWGRAPEVAMQLDSSTLDSNTLPAATAAPPTPESEKARMSYVSSILTGT